MKPVAFLIPRITGDFGVSESVCVHMCVSACVCAMLQGLLHIMGQAEDGCDSEMDESVLSFSGTVSASGLFSATWSFRRARLEPQEQYVQEELLVPCASWLPLEHAQTLREVFSSAVQSTHIQATAPGLQHSQPPFPPFSRT